MRTVVAADPLAPSAGRVQREAQTGSRAPPCRPAGEGPRTECRAALSHSAGSEVLNWVTLGGAMQRTDLAMELLAYVPVYRTPAATGGGWAFARWR